MNEDVPRSIRFPKTLWEAIDADAQRSKRSAVKQMEAVLSAYYELEDVEINKQRLEIVGELMPRGKKRIGVLENSAATEKKRAG